MLQEEQIRNLTQLKELFDAGILSEEEFAKEKAKVMSDTGQRLSPQAKQEFRKPENRTVANATAPSVFAGPANVGLSPGLVLPLGILAILLALASGILGGLSSSDYFGFYDALRYGRMADVCSLLGLVAELVLWVCAFNTLSTRPEGSRLGSIPLWTYLFLGIDILAIIVGIAVLEMELVLIIGLVSLAFGYVAFISLCKAYTGKMRSYSIAWMAGQPLIVLFVIFDSDIISTLIEITIYVFLMIAMLEKKED